MITYDLKPQNADTVQSTTNQSTCRPRAKAMRDLFTNRQRESKHWVMRPTICLWSVKNCPAKIRRPHPSMFSESFERTEKVSSAKISYWTTVKVLLFHLYLLTKRRGHKNHTRNLKKTPNKICLLFSQVTLRSVSPQTRSYIGLSLKRR